MKILIVEDEEALSRVLEERFKSEGFEVEVARDGEVAVEMANKILPGVIILDLILPKKMGFEVLKEIKKNPDLEKVPVIVVSNLGEDENIKQALKMGANDYFVKSQHPIEEIIDKVKNYTIQGL